MPASFLVALIAATSPTVPAPIPTQADLEAATQAWHTRRLKALTADDGWLTLVGLQWLNEGANELHLPPPAPQPAGQLTREGSKVRFAPNPAAAATLGGKPFAGGELKTDADGAEPDVVQAGRLKLYLISRGDRIGVRVKDPEAPARVAFHGIERFKAALAYRVVARFAPFAAPKKLSVPTVLGTVEPMNAPGTLSFELQGQTFTLTPVIEDGENKLFIIFGDETNKSQTYGAGRFLYADLPKNGEVVLDFNRAVNPPCAFSPFATCPLPPKENRLKLAVEAGEKRYGDH